MKKVRFFTVAVGLILALMLGNSFATSHDNAAGASANTTVSKPAKQSNTQASTMQQAITTAGNITNYTESPVLVGGNVDITANNPHSAFILGGQVALGGNVGRNAVVSGGKLQLNGKVGRGAYLVGGLVNLSKQSSVASGGFILGGEVNLAGNISKDVRVIAGKVNIAGNIDGNLNVVAGNIRVAPTARISGKLEYISPNPVVVAPGAIVKGGVSKMPQQDVAQAKGTLGGAAWMQKLMFVVGMFIIGIVLSLLFPRFAGSVACKFATRFWSSFGMGVLTFIVTPIVAFVLFATVVGVSLGVLLLVFYALALTFAYVYAAQGLGLLCLRIVGSKAQTFTSGKLIIAVLLGMIVLYIFSLIPYAGAWLIFIALMFGLGALVMALYGCHKACGTTCGHKEGDERVAHES